jgi:glucose-6-phosphate-specific signal transduction histidine kinase
MPWLFTLVLAVHIGAGVVALTSFWGAIATVKGGAAHRRWGRVFANAIYAAGFMALTMGALSLVWPLAMHTELTDATLYRGMFGTMMVYLGLLVLSMTRYGLVMVANRRDHDANRHWSMLALQGTTLVAAAICLAHGVWLLNRNGIIMETALMILVALLGFGTTLTYFRYIFAPPASPKAYIAEHLKAMVATGIAAYTAFLSVGLIEMFPEHAFNPVIWAVPTVIGMGLIIHFLKQQHGARPRAAPAGSTPR